MAIFTESFCKEIINESLFKDNPETKYKFHGKPVRSGRNGKIDDKVEIGLKVLEKNYDKFLVPTNFVESVKIKRHYTSAQQADLDIKTSVNKSVNNFFIVVSPCATR